MKKLYFYRSPKGSIIDIIICKNEVVEFCFKLFPEEQTQSKQYELLRAFKNKNSDYFSETAKLVALTGTLVKLKDSDISIYPWESIA